MVQKLIFLVYVMYTHLFYFFNHINIKNISFVSAILVKISICICQNVGVCVMFSYTDYSSSIVPQTVALMNEEINRRLEKFTKFGLSLQPSIFVVEDLVETSNYVNF